MNYAFASQMVSEPVSPERSLAPRPTPHRLGEGGKKNQKSKIKIQKRYAKGHLAAMTVPVPVWKGKKVLAQKRGVDPGDYGGALDNHYDQ
jgi:hypothetical protein